MLVALNYEYSGNRLTAFNYPLGGAIRYTYNGDGLLTSVTDANNHTFVTNEYYAQGRVVRQLDASGNATTFTYSQSLVTSAMERPLEPQVNAGCAWCPVQQSCPAWSEINFDDLTELAEKGGRDA
jgi:YD repeat-containing protein